MEVSSNVWDDFPETKKAVMGESQVTPVDITDSDQSISCNEVDRLKLLTIMHCENLILMPKDSVKRCCDIVQYCTGGYWRQPREKPMTSSYAIMGILSQLCGGKQHLQVTEWYKSEYFNLLI